VVLQLTESISGSGRNVTTDNFFTSYQLSKELTKRNLTLVGTVRGNRKEIPLDMLPAADREVKSSVFGFSADGATMVSYVPSVARRWCCCLHSIGTTLSCQMTAENPK